jgi:D-sedoheptulose 7-phosphate isomerase
LRATAVPGRSKETTRLSDDAARAKVRDYLLASAEAKRQAAAMCLDSVVAAARAVAKSLRQGGKLLICGNGGSAADSQHLAAEFVSQLDKRCARAAMAAIALTTDTSILTAISNDLGYSHVFERQIEALARVDDALLGISTSGNSENIARALQFARRKHIKTIALTGADGGKLKDIADVAIRVPSCDVQHIQEVHLAIEHLLVLLTEEELFGREG